ncbi:MAG: leucine-rich repeat domain-containing protein [Eubacteriales bacterium]
MDEKELEHFKFKVKKGQMTLVEYTGEEEKVVIPDEFQGQAVTVIGKESFCFGKANCVEVVFPKSLEVIETCAFENCADLKIIQFPNTLREIRQDAFCNCSSLEEVIFPSSLEKVVTSAFYGCTSLKKAVAESENTKIAPSAFDRAENLVDVSFSILKKLPVKDQVRILGNLLDKFSTLAEDVQGEIKDFLKKKANLRKEFFLYGNLDVVGLLMELKGKLTLEQVDEYLESSIAREDTAVTAIFLDYKNKKFSKQVQDDYNENKELVEIGLELPTLKQFKTKWKCKKVEGGICITEYIGNETHEVIPAELADGTKIVKMKGQYTVDLGSIVHLEIKANLKTLYQMSSNQTLETIVLPESIDNVEGRNTFYGCKMLKSVNLPQKITSLTEKMFYQCVSLEQIVIPENVIELGHSVFYECAKLKEIVLPESIAEIPHSVFSKCSSLSSVTLPKMLTKIGRNCFWDCTSLKNLNFPEYTVEVDEFVFFDCPYLADEHGFLIFQNVLYHYFGTAEKVVIPDGVKVVAKRCFEKTNIKEVVLPSSLEALEYSAFSQCESLETVVGTDHLKEIGAYAFYKCSNLNPCALPDSLEILDNKSISDCPKFADKDGFVIIRNRLYNYYGKETAVSIPEGVEELEGNSFYHATAKEIILPSTLKVLNDKAFEFANALEKIIFPQNLADVGMLEYGKMNLKMPRIIEFEIME